MHLIDQTEVFFIVKILSFGYKYLHIANTKRL